jgi:S-adenosylmethionine decarboxylase
MKKYGPHLTLDLVGCNPAKVSDAEYMYNFLIRLSKAIGMNLMGHPHLDFYNGIHPTWGGTSGSVHIQESHMTYHAFNWGYLCLDIFSCKDFDFEGAVKWIMDDLESDQHEPLFTDDTPEVREAREFLKHQKSEWNLMARGKNFPNSLK